MDTDLSSSQSSSATYDFILPLEQPVRALLAGTDSPCDSTTARTFTSEPSLEAGSSDVWKHFEVVAGEDNVKCRVHYKDGRQCNLVMTYRVQHGTQNLRRHLKRKHADVFMQSCDMQATLRLGERLQVLKPRSKESWRHSLTTFIVDAGLPMSISVSPAFQTFMTGACAVPRSWLSCRTSVSDAIFDQYRAKKQQLCERLKTQEAHVSLTMDAWTAFRVTYLAIMGRWLNNAGEVKQTVLTFVALESSHAACVLTRWLQHTIELYQIQGRVVAVTADGAPVNRAAVRHYDPSLPVIHCLAHVVNLIVQTVLAAVMAVPSETGEGDASLVSEPGSSSVCLLRAILARIRRSSIMTSDLQQLCDRLRIARLNVIIDCPTRWDSTLDMIERAIKLRSAITSLIEQSPELEPFALNVSDWRILQEMVKFLSFFKEMTKLVSQGTASFASDYIPIIQRLDGHILTTLAQYRDGPLYDMANAARQRLADFKATAYDCRALQLATILDARYKGHPTHSLSAVAHILLSALEGGELEAGRQPPTLASASSPASTACLLHLDQDPVPFPPSIEEEIWLYLQCPKAKTTLPGYWWTVHAEHYPALASLAARYIAMQSSTVGVERLFSRAGCIMSADRASMCPETLTALVCLSFWSQEEV